ncbi:MAG: DUF2510 domain-containing protein [Trebonia sp.]
MTLRGQRRTRMSMPIEDPKKAIRAGAVILIVGVALTAAGALFADASGGTLFLGIIVSLSGLAFMQRASTQRKRDRMAAAQRPAQPPEWYPDPQNQAMLRWWDGSSWTAETKPLS